METSIKTTIATNIPTRLNLRGILWFLGIAYGLAWLLDLPMALSGKGLASPWASLIVLQNLTPAVATLLVARWISPLPHMRRATGLRWGAKGSRWGWYWLFGLLGLTVFNVAAPFVGALFGAIPLDLAHLSGLRAFLQAAPGGTQLLRQVSAQTIAIVIIATLPLQALLISPINFGEEWGWRGYLLPQLLPLGQWRAVLISGAIWGFWHAPLILMGFDYPQHHLLGVGLIMAFGMIIGTLLGWTRLATGSVWPAVLGHAAVDANQVAGGVYVLLPANAQFDTALGGLTGVTGWILPVLFIAFLALTHRLPVRNPPDLADPHGGGSAEAPAMAPHMAEPGALGARRG
jgi:membrane protease YdiL (CAAX protease family)